MDFSKQLSYPEQCEESARIDEEFGLEVEKNETLISPKENVQLWTSVPPSTFLTPYHELYEMLTRLNLRDEESIIDLGAGYGRLGILIGKFYPSVNFIGYELAKPRVLSAQKCFEQHAFSNSRMYHQDLSSPEFTPPSAEYYFIYDYGTREAIEKTMNDLRTISTQRSRVGLPGITVIGRARASRDCIERMHPWLSQVNPPVHCGNYSIYRA